MNIKGVAVLGVTMGSAEADLPASRLPPVASTNLDEQIYDRIKVMIAEGLLLPGERIVPDQLAHSMGVSSNTHSCCPEAPVAGPDRRVAVTAWRFRAPHLPS